jgi:hypothetical protein
MNSKRELAYTQGVAVTPSDTVNIPTGKTRALWVGGVGNVRAIMGGVEVNFLAVPAGTLLKIVCTRVNTTGTTATNIVALN